MKRGGESCRPETPIEITLPRSARGHHVNAAIKEFRIFDRTLRPMAADRVSSRRANGERTAPRLIKQSWAR